VEEKKQLIVKNMRHHNLYLSEFATHDEEAIRFQEIQEDIRPAFFHDIDRIIYSYSYTRYMDKTQVFSYQDNDHISKRMLHVQLVSKIARTIGRALGLNEDLIEAASLGHDLGHVPFGHVGEAILNQISLEENEGYFHHNIQSVRLLMFIEQGGEGRNLTLQVLDAIMCHNGEFLEQNYQPQNKTKEQFLAEYHQTYQDAKLTKKLVPMTLEGCVVRISDMIAYLGRDIDDACMLGVFDKSEIPKEIVDVLGVHNRDIINTIIMDVIENSIGKNALSFSKPIFEAMKKLKQFNMEHIYVKANPKENWERYEKMFRCVFKHCMEDITLERRESAIYQDFLQFKNETYQTCNKARKVIDYLAGMTDDYLLKLYSIYRK
jgi:dGTPase